MIITSTGYFNTGSSAITNIFQEFDIVSDKSGVYEIRLLHDPDCISDLEYNLIDNPNRHNTSHAIKRFLRYIDNNSNGLINHHYEILCDGNFKKSSYEYIDELCDFKFYGRSYVDMIDRSVFFNIINRIYTAGIKKVFGTKRPSWIKASLLSDKTVQYAGTFDRERFLDCTRRYLDALFSYCNPEKKDWLFIDQLFPPTNIGRYKEYLPLNQELRVFVVDRDPRDLYVTCKYYLNIKTIPCNNVESFCEWYKWTRGQGRVYSDPAYVMRIQFEDLVYDYEFTRDKILSFCNLDGKSCEKKGNIFVPEKSLQNTQVWHRFPQSYDEVELIEKRLEEYCYDYDSKIIKPDFLRGRMFDC